ncbi:hypothetical protein KY290_019086 [Solanum tuberosum]|uniref:Protein DETOXIFICATION n=1 Tax=Solanum tuberosum TaxID=4113 RepID=A0ABQ7VI59_SOLTU|nr:hypothetical protein KY290_019086 [Solanum tuberosum]
MEAEHGNSSPLIVKQNGFSKEEIVEEVKKQIWLAGPLVSVNLLQFSLQLISIMFVGHLGELPLSGASMANSFTSVTGISLLMGMSSALDTFCGQSYGAKQYHMLGIHMQRAMIILSLVCIPLAVIWANTGPILKFLGQDPSISDEAVHYAMYFIPGVFAYGLLQCVVRFLQTQSIVIPMVLCAGLTTLIHVVVCWILVFKTELGVKGAALASSISYWINFLFLALYVKFSPTCAKTWTRLSKEALKDMLAFVRLAIPSAIMVCLEMWSFELMVLLSGLLPNSQLETSVLSICLNTSATVWMISIGLSGTVSTRIANELGAGHPQIAHLALHVVLAVTVIKGIVLGLIILLLRNVWGYAYSNETEVVRYIAIMMLLLATSNFIDGLQCVLSGALRGFGWQKIGAIINLGSYYFVGIPCAVLMAFVLHIGGKAKKAQERGEETILPGEIVY